jgi:N-methylhydantoinase A
VTDANLVLGRLVETEFLGGEMCLDRARAERAVGRLARRLGRTLEAAAAGIVQVANATMERAIRVVTVERGHDPRGFTLLAFGGAGGLHAAEIAGTLGMRRVYVPRQPGLLSAWGVLTSEVVRDYGRTVRVVSPPEAVLRAGFETLVRTARRDLGREGVHHIAVERIVDARYAGQAYEVAVAWQRGWRTAFDRAHARLFGHADSDRPVEVVTLRLRARGGGAPVPSDPPARPGPRARSRMRRVVFDGRPHPTAVHRRDELVPGRRLRGPAIVCEYSATTLVPPGWRLTVDRLGGLLLQLMGR